MKDKLLDELRKEKKSNKKLIVGSVVAGTVAVAGVVAGVVLSKPKTYEVSVVDNQPDYNAVWVNHTPTTSAGTFKRGDTVYLCAANIAGYTFDGWFLQGSSEPVSTELIYAIT